MGLFNKKAKNKQPKKDMEVLAWEKEIKKYISESHLQDLYTGENEEAVNQVAITSAAKGTIPQFQNTGIRTLYAEQLVLEAQNWMQIRQNNRLIKQNDEIIKLLKENK